MGPGSVFSIFRTSSVVDFRTSSIIKNKKIDVYKNGVKIASIGDLRYKDYPTYLEERGLTSDFANVRRGLTSDFANVRRALYHNRHKKNIKIRGSNGWLSSILLW